MEAKRVCKKCLLRDMEISDQENIARYLSVIKEQDRTKDDIYEERLSTCKACERLEEATCEACGCYVEFRAAVRHGSCPYHKWSR